LRFCTVKPPKASPYLYTPAEELAKEVIGNLGYQAIIGFVPNPDRPVQQLKALICCRSNLDDRFVGFDFLLPVLSWVPRAVQVAQANKLDYGFALVPTITPEDLVLAKLQALQSPNSRPYDLDDITEIANCQQLNLEYLLPQAKALHITIAASTLSLLKKT
jgi:hypothetical protein